MKRKLLWTSLLACLLLALLCCAAESGDFTIDENGVLTKYTGSDAVVTVPDGVTAIGKEAFYAKSAITEIHLPTGITLIGDSAFRSCTGLTELQLPTGITSIGANAFRSCTGLTEIVVPDSVETIGDNAFYDCSSLTSLRLSQGLKTLGTNVFLRCNSLTEIEIPAGVESVGNYIASNTLRLRCAVGSSAAKALSKAQNDFWVEDFRLRYAFDSDGSAASLTLKKYAGDATSATIPDGVTIVGDSAFERNTSLTAVVLPDSVVTIGANAFRSCTGLTAVTLSQNLNEIKTYAFGGCTGLTYIDIPAGLQKSQYIMGTSDERVQLRCAIGSDAAKALSEGGDSFCADDYQLRYSFDSDGQVTGLTVRKYLGSAAVVTLPEGTTEIGSEVFENHTEITEVVLPETLVTIGSYAFDGCTGLMRIVLPETLKTISFHAFVNCAALTEIVLPDGLTSLGSHAFYGCKKLTEMRVPDGILTLEVATFEYCANLTKVVLPSKLEKIANYAFDNCKALKEIQIPETVVEIGSSAFQYCAGLTELTLPEGLQTIGESAFVGCSGLTRLAIPDGVQSVGINAFHSINAQLCCSMGSRAAEALSRVGYDFYTETWKLRYTFDSDKQVNGLRAERYLGSDAAVTLPEGTTLIGGSAFKDCAFITSVTLPEKLLSIGNYAFSGCMGLTEIVIPDSVTTIGSYAFSGCTGLKEIVIPDSVTAIGSYAFSGCTGLTEIVIPDSVTTIGSYAFSGCTGLTEIVIPDSVTTIGSYAFSGCTGLTRVVLPAGLTAIPDRCFNNCEKLPGIAIPETVTSIGSCAFRYCSALTAITLPQGLQTLGGNAFLYCENLPYVDVPDTLESAGYSIASDTTQLRCSIGSSAAYALSKKNNSFYNNGYGLCYTYADRDGSVTGLALLKYAGTEAEVRVPDGVTELLYLSFCSNSAVTSVILPETVVKIGEKAFSECKNLTSVTLPQGIVEIQSYAFSVSPKLKVIDIPDGLQKAARLAEDNVQFRCSFGSSAAFALSKGGNNFCAGDFQMRYLFDEDGNRNGLRLNKYLGTDTEVTVPEEVTETGSAFSGCATVTKITLPAGLTNLKNSAFSDCTALREIVIPESVTSIGESAFDGCASLIEIRLPAGITEIPTALFSGCKALSAASIPEGVVSIGSGAFRNCASLTELALPQGLKKIGSNAFIGCKSLTYIEIPDGVEMVEYFIAESTIQLRCAIGSSAAIAVSRSNDGFYSDDLYLRYTFDDDGVQNGLTLMKYVGASSEVIVPDGVTELQYSTFSECRQLLTRVVLPNGLLSIPESLLNNCTNLKEVVIPESVTTIENHAFFGCASLEKINLPAGLTEISQSLLGGCTVLSEITIPDGVTAIGDSAFQKCASLTEIVLPQGLRRIDGEAFFGCTGLSYIDIPDGLETAGNWIADDSVQLRCSLGSSAAIALSRSDNGFCVDGLRLRYRFDDDGNTNGLTVKRYLGSETEVTVPDGVDSIGDSAFYGCKGLTKLALPQGLKEIGVNAFLGCEGLSYIDIPDGVETVGDWIASESIQLRCSIGSSAAIALSKAEQNFCVDDFAVRHSFTDGGAVNGLIAERYVGGKVGAVLTLPQGVTETSQYLLNEEPLENVMCLKLPEGFKKLTIDNLLWRSAVVFPESIQSIAIEEEWEGAPPVIFYCYRDTVAESFAQKRGITIVYLDGFKPAQTTVAMRSDYTLPIGSELRLSEIAAAVPSMPENCALNAVSSNPEVLQVESDGTIRVVGKGDAMLRVSLSRYPDIYAEACVWGYVQPTSATLAEEIWIPAKATRDLLKKDLIILPADSRAPIGYGMDNWELFEQLEGEFTLMAVNRGDTALYVEVPGFDTLTAQIHVTARFSELAFEQTAITIPADTRATLCAQAVTTTHTYVNEYMTFESSAPDVATVDEDGVVYGVSEGSATITATSYNGLTAACTVNVQGGNGSRLKLPAFLKEIGEEAFAGCSEESVIVPDGCETIGARAFADSANLRTITIPASVTSIAADAFDGCTDLTIRTPKGSYASRYAAAHGFGCVAE